MYSDLVPFCTIRGGLAHELNVLPHSHAIHAIVGAAHWIGCANAAGTIGRHVVSREKGIQSFEVVLWSNNTCDCLART